MSSPHFAIAIAGCRVAAVSLPDVWAAANVRLVLRWRFSSRAADYVLNVALSQTDERFKAVLGYFCFLVTSAEKNIVHADEFIIEDGFTR